MLVSSLTDKVQVIDLHINTASKMSRHQRLLPLASTRKQLTSCSSVHWQTGCVYLQVLVVAESFLSAILCFPRRSLFGTCCFIDLVSLLVI